jgi:hypothetical protein
MNAQSPEAKPASTPFSVKFAYICLIIIAAIFFPLTVLFCACMLPAFVAALVDGHVQKTAGVTVGAMNLAGTLPAILSLMNHGGTIGASISLLLDPTTLMYAYGAAMAGWWFYAQVPKIVSGMLVRRAEKRVRQIDVRHQELVRKWGEKVNADSGVKFHPQKQN